MILLKRKIEEQGLKQRFIAAKAQVPESYLSMYLHGKFNLTQEQKKRIAETLGSPLDELFEV